MWGGVGCDLEGPAGSAAAVLQARHSARMNPRPWWQRAAGASQVWAWQALTPTGGGGPRCARQVTGNAILAELQRQRETIQHARQQAQQTDANVQQAEGVLKKMGRWWRF